MTLLMIVFDWAAQSEYQPYTKVEFLYQYCGGKGYSAMENHSSVSFFCSISLSLLSPVFPTHFFSFSSNIKEGCVNSWIGNFLDKIGRYMGEITGKQWQPSKLKVANRLADRIGVLLQRAGSRKKPAVKVDESSPSRGVTGMTSHRCAGNDHVFMASRSH